jgi:NAD+ diphosphatase
VTPEPNAFTGAALDRASDGRRLDAAWLAEQRADPAARALVAGDRGLLVRDGRLELVPLASLNGAEPVLLGLDEHGPVYAHDEDPVHEGLPPLIGGGVRGERPPGANGERLALRAAAATLSRADGGLAAYACALLNWHRRHRFCANCAHDTELVEGGLTRRCPRCGAEHHPRTDPVVIMLVTDGAERLLLGRQAAWPTGRYSALAGFVEPGESLEEAVAREVCEETSVRIGRPRYIASQPWPFPASLMLGFSAPYAGGEPSIRDGELQDARWFDREEIAHAAAERDNHAWGTPGDPGGPLQLPPRLAIARRLVEDWLAGGPGRKYGA